MAIGLNAAQGYISLSDRPCTLMPCSHPGITFSIWARPAAFTQVSEGRLNTNLCCCHISDRCAAGVTPSPAVTFPGDSQASSSSEVKGSCHSPQHQLEKPQQCVKSASRESLGGEEGKKRRHCNGTLLCLTVCLSVSKDFWVNKYQSKCTRLADLQSSLHLWRK